MPAYPRKLPIQTDDGIVYIRLFGDEHCKRAETIDGYTIIQKSSLWYYAEADSTEGIKASPYKLSANPNGDTKRFLNSIPLHLKALDKKDSGRHMEIKSHVKSVQGTRRILVILMQYNDLPFIKSQEDFDRLFNYQNYSEDGAQGSVCDFYTDVSYGQLQLVCDVIGPFTSKHDREFYGGNDRSGNDNRPEELFEEAINHAVQQVALKDYDTDGDGFVDNVHIIFAGHGEEAGASDDAIWSHEATFYQPYEIQGMKIDRYSCAPELRSNRGNGISRIGPHCHEIGHALGAMDYYDTDYSIDGEFDGTGDWDVMASGSWNNEGVTPADFNPYVKSHDFGWIMPKDLPFGEITISPSYYDSNNYYMLRSPNANDFYLLENRSKEKWGAAIPGEGLLIFHVGSDIETVGNNINSQAPQRCYIVSANSQHSRPNSSASSYGNINSAGCPYPGTSNNTNFGQASTPVAFYWDEEMCGIEIDKIQLSRNGDIYLENNSIDIGGEAEYNTLYFEGFEGEEIQISIESEGEDAPKWQIEENTDSPSKYIEKPSAYSGNKCIQLSAKRRAGIVRGAFSFGFASPDLRGRLQLRLFANSLNPATDTPNLIRVGYRYDLYTDWEYTEITSSKNNQWIQSKVLLPDSIMPQIKLEGIVHAGSILAIDNIKVEQVIENETGNSIETMGANSQVKSIYSLSGIKQTNPYKGIYIIRNEDGRVSKRIIKR